MAALHPGFSAEVLQVQPDWRCRSCRQLMGKCIGAFDGRVAAEGFHPDIGRWQRVHQPCRQRVGPVQHLHTRVASLARLRCHPVQIVRAVDPQAHLLSAGGQIGTQAPAHADVTQVVHHPAEDVPAQRRSDGSLFNGRAAHDAILPQN